MLSMLLLVLVQASISQTPARAQAFVRPASPYDYGLRFALFPVAFQAGISQSAFGSAARGELDLGRYLTLHLGGRLGWAALAGERDVPSYAARASLSISLIDRMDFDDLAGTAYPKGDDPARIGGQKRGTDSDFGGPISERLGGPALRLPERPEHLRASLRTVHALRLGFDHVRAVERLRPSAVDGSRRHADNHLNMLALGYGWSTHWNLTAAEAGERTLGFRRFYFDALFTLPELYSAQPLPGDDDGMPNEHLAIGARVGMEGAFDALLEDFDGFGLGYTVEAGGLPGDSGLEGYLFVALGVELDALTR